MGRSNQDRQAWGSEGNFYDSCLPIGPGASLSIKVRAVLGSKVIRQLVTVICLPLCLLLTYCTPLSSLDIYGYLIAFRSETR